MTTPTELLNEQDVSLLTFDTIKLFTKLMIEAHLGPVVKSKTLLDLSS